jgi:hypothetical protein
MVPDFEAIQFGGTISQSYHLSDKFVTGSYGSLAVPCPMLVTPKEGSTRVTLYVAGAHTGTLNLQQYFTRARLRHRTFFEPVIARAMRHYCWHGFW